MYNYELELTNIKKKETNQYTNKQKLMLWMIKKIVSKNLNNFEALYYGVPWPLTINVEHHQILQNVI